MVSSITFKSLIQLGLIFIWCKIMVQFHSFASCPVFPVPFIEDCIFPAVFT